jgi:chemotaxis protein histidine kinase CheA
VPRFFLILGFLISCSSSLIAKTIGSPSEDTQYRSLEDARPLYGVLSVAVYNSSYSSDKEISAAENYDVKINDYLVSKIRQDSKIIKSGVGNFSYLRIELPNGVYKVQISKNDFFATAAMNSFEVIIKESKELSVVVRNEIPRAVPSIVVRGFSAAPTADIFPEEYEKLTREAEIVAVQSKNKFSAEKEKKDAEKAQHAAQMRVFSLKAREEEDSREKAKAVASAEAQKEKEKADLAKKQEQEKLEAEDDKTCKSFGAKSGTHPYIVCRVSLINSRNERSERQAANKQLEEKLESLQTELAKQESRRSFEAERAEQQRLDSEAALQKRWNEEKARRDKALRLEQAQRAFEAAAAMSQPQPAGQSGGNFPFQNYNINGRMWNCNTIGNITNCR